MDTLKKLKIIISKTKKYKCNNRFLLAVDKLMTEMHLKQPRLIYSACVPFPKTNSEYENLKKQ